MKHGGKRKGAGRPRELDGDCTAVLSVRVDPVTLDAAREAERHKRVGLADFLRKKLSEYAGFRKS